MGGSDPAPAAVASGNGSVAAATVDYTAAFPSFDADGSPNVTAALGKTALLTCRVKGMSNRTVSRVHQQFGRVRNGRYRRHRRSTSVPILTTVVFNQIANV